MPNTSDATKEPAHASISIMPEGRELKISLIVHPLPNPDEAEPQHITLARRLHDIATGAPKAFRHMIKIIRGYLIGMSPEQRLQAFHSLTAGWCTRCGGPAPCKCRGKIILAATLPDEPEPRS